MTNDVRNDVLVVHGDTPLRGEVRVRGAKNLVSKAMVAASARPHAEPPLRRAPHPRRRGGPRAAGAARRTGQRRGRAGRAGARSDQCGPGQRRRDQRARRVEPDPDPVLRSAAAPDRARVHPRPRRLPHRRPADRLPPAGAARVRRPGRQDAAGAATSPRPNGLHGTKFDLPYPSVGATEQVLLTAVLAEGVTELRNAAVEPEIMDLICVLQKMGAIIKVHTDRVIEIEGVTRLERLRAPPDPGPDRGGELGRGGAGHRRRRLRPRRPAGRHDDVPQRVPVHRRQARHRGRPGRRHPVLAPGRRADARSRSRPTCTPAS